MKRYILIILALMISVQIAFTQSVHYEYWIDNNYNEKEARSTSNRKIVINNDIGHLDPGFHYLNFQTIDRKSNQRGAVSRILFLVSDVASTMKNYEYWFDNDHNNAKSASSSSFFKGIPINVSHLTAGLHYFNFRTQDVSGAWGGIARYLFMIQDGTNSIAKNEYWFDDDYDSRKTSSGYVPTFNLPVDISHLKPGLHYFNFRTQSVSGSWGALAHYLFMVMNDANDIKELEYWIDNKQSKTEDVNSTNENIELIIDINDLETEITHTLSLIGKSYSGEIALSDSYEFTIDATGIIDITKCDGNEEVEVYSLNGVLLIKGKRLETLKALPKGIYIVNGKKMIFK